MLGHANISQTDTYLNAGRMGLHDSMRRFEKTGIRCTPVVQESPIERRIVSNAPAQVDSKNLLH
jgi:hypothetical protein